ncbi:MAG TPA: extracellular solute-binding protein, partial [Microbacterium sp.]|nr:extracellular solute-binding protein [Microbacterium sp.]
FQFYSDLVESGAASPNSPTYGWEETDDNFATGLNATFTVGNWLAEREESNPDTMGDVSVHPIPHPEGGEPATYLESKPMFVMAGSDNVDGAKALAREFASEEWQKAGFMDRSALPAATSDSKWSKDFNALLDTGIVFPPIAMGQVTQDMQDSLAMVLQDGDSPEDAATWLGDAINSAIEESAANSAE